MVVCAASTCKNSHIILSKKFHRFPRETTRRQIWIDFCKKPTGWQPNEGSRLCNDHFDQNQFEQHRSDGRKLLAPFAVPVLYAGNIAVLQEEEFVASKEIGSENVEITIVFDNDPGILNEHSYCQTNNSEVEFYKKEIFNLQKMLDSKTEELISAKHKIDVLEKEIESKHTLLKRFLSEEQIRKLQKPKTNKWSDDVILQGLKLRFALGKYGYIHLQHSKYPIPSYSTLNRRVAHFKIDFGVLANVFLLLERKVCHLVPYERDCHLSIDEMEISGKLDYDKTSTSFVGNVTLGNPNDVGRHLTIAMLRGYTSHWKQIVAVNITGPSTTGDYSKQMVFEILETAEAIGLNVLGITTDMGPNNRAMWNKLGVGVSKTEQNVTFVYGDLNILVFADPQHLLKNWKTAMLNEFDIYLSEKTTKENNLPINIINGKHIRILFEFEKQSSTGLKLLHHLDDKCLYPSHHDKMNVGAAVKYFSLKTAVALETAVDLKLIDKNALTTAWFIRLIYKWFELLSSRTIEKSITKNNKETKYEFLQNFINIIHEIRIDNKWKPLNTGSIMTTLSFIYLTKSLFNNKYNFVLGSRISQDALENVFSQIRRKSGSHPTGLAAKRAVRSICLSQFMSDIKNTNYCNDSDFALLELQDITTINNKNQQSHESDTLTDNANIC